MNKFGQILAAGVCLSSLVTLAAPVYAEDGSVLKIENFIGTIEVVTGDHDKVSIKDADGVSYDKTGSSVVIDGDESARNRNCRHNGKKIKIGSGRSGWFGIKGDSKDISEYPNVKIVAPENVHLIIENSIVFGRVGTIGSGDIRVRSCGDLELAGVTGALDLGVSGSGDVKMGDAGNADISISGSGDLIAGSFANLDLSISGSGDAELGDVEGAAHIHVSGSGDVIMGRVEGGLDYSGSGSSDMTAKYVGGDLSVEGSGSGDVSIEDGDVEMLHIVASGASDIEYWGTSVNADARAGGGSDININRPSGQLRTRDSGGGDVNVRG